MLDLNRNLKEKNHVALMISVGESDQNGKEFGGMVQSFIKCPNIEDVTIVICDTLHRFKLQYVNQYKKILNEDEASKEAEKQGVIWEQDPENIKFIKMLEEAKGKGNVRIIHWEFYKSHEQYNFAKKITEEFITNGYSESATKIISVEKQKELLSKRGGSDEKQKKNSIDIKNDFTSQVGNFVKKDEEIISEQKIEGIKRSDLYKAEKNFLCEEAAVRLLMMLLANDGKNNEIKFDSEIYRNPLNKFLLDLHLIFASAIPFIMQPTFFRKVKKNDIAPLGFDNSFFKTAEINIDGTLLINGKIIPISIHANYNNKETIQQYLNLLMFTLMPICMTQSNENMKVNEKRQENLLNNKEIPIECQSNQLSTNTH